MYPICLAKVNTELGQPPPHATRDLETQTTYDPQTWQRGLYVQWSIRPRSLVMIRDLSGEDWWRQSSAVCEKHVFSAAVDENERNQSLVWVSTPQREKPYQYVFCFRSHLIPLYDRYGLIPLHDHYGRIPLCDRYSLILLIRDEAKKCLESSDVRQIVRSWAWPSKVKLGMLYIRAQVLFSRLEAGLWDRGPIGLACFFS